MLATSVAALLAGCAGPLGTSASMTPEQLKELARVKDAACSKLSAIYMGASINVVSVNVDKGIPPRGGSVKIGPECTTEITSEAAPK